MTIEQTLLQRSGSKCERFTSEEDLSVYGVAPSNGCAEQAAFAIRHLPHSGQQQQHRREPLALPEDSIWTPESAGLAHAQAFIWRRMGTGSARYALSGEGCNSMGRSRHFR